MKVLKVLQPLIFLILLSSLLVTPVSSDEVEFEEISVFGTDGFDFFLSLDIDSDGKSIIGGHVNYPLAFAAASSRTLYEGPFYDRDTSFEAFPMKNSFDNSYNGLQDIVIAKLDPTGDIIWSTYIGSNQTDAFSDLIVDHSDNILVVGATKGLDYPTATGDEIVILGNQDGVLSKLNEDGSLIFSKTFSGSGSDEVKAVTVDSENNIIIAGGTTSDDLVTINAHQPTNLNADDGRTTFIEKMTEDGTTLWSTYLGGSTFDYPTDITVDENDLIYVLGWTQSTDFPEIDNPIVQDNEQTDGFVSVFSKDGLLLKSWKIGGELDDVPGSLEIDSSGNIVIGGYTYSRDFPGIPEGMLINEVFSNAPRSDAFLLKLDNSGKILFSRYLGGSLTDIGKAIDIADDGSIFITGETSSRDFPIHADFTETPDFNKGKGKDDVDEQDVFVSKYSPLGQIMWSIYYGGESSDRASDLKVDQDGFVNILGYTDSRFNFGNTPGEASLSLFNVHLSRLPVPDGFFPRVKLQSLDDNDQFYDQPLFRALFTIFVVVGATALLRYSTKKYKQLQERRILKNRYNETHGQIGTLLGEESAETGMSMVKKIKNE